jgi:hypothetical protein
VTWRRGGGNGCCGARLIRFWACGWPGDGDLRAGRAYTPAYRHLPGGVTRAKRTAPLLCTHPMSPYATAVVVRACRCCGSRVAFAFHRKVLLLLLLYCRINQNSYFDTTSQVFGPVWGRLTQLISAKSKINPLNGPLFTLRSWIAIAKKSPPPQRFQKRTEPRVTKKILRFPPAPRFTDSSSASPPRPALDLASRGAPPARSSSPSSPPASNRAAASSPACGSACSPPSR